MEKIKLDLVPKRKLLYVNNKTIKIPKLGLKHRLLANPENNHEESLKIILNSIHPNLSVAERDLVTIHLLQYNGKILDEKVINEISYKLDDVYICQKLKFVFNDYEFKFRSPTFDLINGPIDVMLKDCCVYVKKSGEKIDIPDFSELPAFVKNWADEISQTVALDGPNGVIKGVYNIVEFFNE